MSTENSPGAARVTPAHASKARSSWMWLSVLLAAVLGVVLFVGTAGAILYNGLSKQLETSVLSTSHLTPAQSGKEEEVVDSFAGRAVNILLMGIDSRTDQSEAIIDPDDVDETMRSDTTLVMHISADRQYVDLVSIPRDMWLYLPECSRSDGSVSEAQWGQFNWAFSYGALTDDMAAGVACTEATVEQITGLEMDGFAVIDFNGFYQMVAALGGVDICLEEAVDEMQYLHLQLPAGCQTLDPAAATQYARVRYIGDGSDMGRIQRQQELLGAMVKKALSQNLLTDMPSLYAFMTSTLQATKVSPSLSNLKTDAGLVNSIRGISEENIRFVTMPVLTTDFDANRLMPKEPLNGELWDSLYNDTALPAGIVYKDLNGEYFTINDEGVPEPGGDGRYDNEVGVFDWSTNDGASGGHSRRDGASDTTEDTTGEDDSDGDY